MDGILNIHKPSGPTSFATVARLRKLVGEPKAGHGGTLDPLACGVLPVFLGQATRLAEYLMEHPKSYRAEIELGVSTDSYDAEGAVTQRSDASGIDWIAVEECLKRFRGDIQQTPPVYSALKQHGQPLYKLARQGQDVEVESRPTSIYRLELVAFNPPALTLEVECSKGTYIRSLAHDLGAGLGCGAHLAGLVRTSYGPFKLQDAVTLEQLERAVADGTWARMIRPMDAVLSLWQKIMLSGEHVEMVRCGVGLSLDSDPTTGRLRAYDKAGLFIGLLKFEAESRQWRPQKVFHPAAAVPEKGPIP
jgi:tRNA pseudouridine 55 synthase